MWAEGNAGGTEHWVELVVFGCGTRLAQGPDLFITAGVPRRTVEIHMERKSISAYREVRGALKDASFSSETAESRRYYYLGHIFLLPREDPCPLVASRANARLPWMREPGMF
jgi:hypothetical protein